MATEFRLRDFSRSKFAHKRFPKLLKKLVAEPNKKKRQVDFLLYRRNKLVGYAEIEVKLVWKRKAWPKKYPNVQFPGRKAHFARTKLPTFMVMFNASGSNVLVVDAKTMRASPLVSRWTRRGTDLLFQVPLDKVALGPDKIEGYILKHLQKF
jgi:hypothetical protein